MSLLSVLYLYRLVRPRGSVAKSLAYIDAESSDGEVSAPEDEQGTICFSLLLLCVYYTLMF
jgi:hypothetical protein